MVIGRCVLSRNLTPLVNSAVAVPLVSAAYSFGVGGDIIDCGMNGHLVTTGDTISLLPVHS